MTTGVYDQMRDHLKEFDVSDCSIRSRDCIYIMFEDHQDEDEDTDVFYRAGFYYPKTERVWGFDGFRNIYRAKSCVIQNGPVVVVDYNGQVLSQKGETEKETKFEGEERIPLIRQVCVLRVREIAGKAYMAGSLRTVFRREGPNNWTCLSGNDLAVRDEEDKQGRDFGFEDIDGFAADDIYACGGDGDLCHYNGEKWTVIDCPTNRDFLSICCAENGQVYVGGMKGVLLEGRGNEWKVIGKCGDAWIKSLAWYKGRLYLATDIGVYEYYDGKIERTPGLSGIISSPVDDSSEQKSKERIKKLLIKGGADEEAVGLVTTNLSGEGILAPAALHTLSTDGELLVVGGADKVAVFDGVTWGILYAPPGINMGGSL